MLLTDGQEVRPEDDAETVRAKVEQEIRKHSDRFTFHDDGSLTVWHRVPGV